MRTFLQKCLVLIWRKNGKKKPTACGLNTENIQSDIEIESFKYFCCHYWDNSQTLI